ncbi:type IV pilus modification PilV family protein [Butyrivibrio sp. AC2005]|uniref:type IV pilus modification PilV family protein n=1 Tax=Butyrivibrio sp. AC2005 TaxID=1280672 RepID=UPI000410EA80|nr:hypothetical protein [Butyrivibrio sp. AC2005]
MRSNIREKIRNSVGETLIETLFALLIAAVALVMLPGAIVAATKANKQSKEKSVYYSAENGSGGFDNHVEVTGFTIE